MYTFYSFEALTRRNRDDVVCGLCDTVGEVYYGDGNSKNCCIVKVVSKNVYNYVQFDFPLTFFFFCYLM